MGNMLYRASPPVNDSDFDEAKVTMLDLIRQAAAVIQRAIERREPAAMRAIRDQPRVQSTSG